MGKRKDFTRLESLPFKGDRVNYNGEQGITLRRDLSGAALWVKFGEIERMFTRRAGNVFRAFPGPADGPILDFR